MRVSFLIKSLLSWICKASSTSTWSAGSCCIFKSLKPKSDCLLICCYLYKSKSVCFCFSCWIAWSLFSGFSSFYNLSFCCFASSCLSLAVESSSYLIRFLSSISITWLYCKTFSIQISSRDPRDWPGFSDKNGLFYARPLLCMLVEIWFFWVTRWYNVFSPGLVA